MRVLGVDQSYTAFAVSLQEGVDSDHITIKKGFPAAKYDSDLQRLVEIGAWFEGYLGQASPDLVVIEGYAAAAKYGREMAGELGAVVKLAVLSGLNQEPVVVAPTRLKKFVIGGTAKKNQMLLGVYKRWGQEFSDDNLADAYALAKLGLAVIGSDDETLTKPQREVIEEIRKAIS